MNHTSSHTKPFNAGQAKRKLRACVSMALTMISLGAMASQSCAPAGGGSGFLPSGGGIICGLPESQNPVVGIGPEQDRKRAEQRAAWSRMLKEGSKTIPVKAGDPVPEPLTPAGAKD